jgi:hypothetical protein
VPEPTVRIEVPDPLAARRILVMLNACVGPRGETVTARLTLPEKPL